MMTVFLWPHIAAGIVAILTGAVAAAVRKGGSLHVRAGTAFVAAMLVLGVTASILEPFRTPKPGSPITGLFVCYFVATSWVSARRRDGTTGKFEMAAGAVALGASAVMAWAGLTGRSTSPAGSGPVLALAALCLFAGAGDLTAVLRRKLTPRQRITRHLWRMCFAFFIATGSFFLGQQKVMPAEIRGSPILFVLAFAPFAVMAFWLVRLRFAKALGKLTTRLASAPPAIAANAAP